MFFIHSDPFNGHLDFLYAWTSVLINRHLFLTVSETGRSKFKMPTWSGSGGEGPLSALHMGSFLLYPHMAKRGSSVVSSYKSTNLHGSTTLVTSSEPYYSPKAPQPSVIIRGLGIQHTDLGTHIQSITVP